MKRKVLGVVLCAALAVSMMTGCGGSSSTTTNTAAETSAAGVQGGAEVTTAGAQGAAATTAAEAQQTANWEQTEGYEKTETILQCNPEITGIICGNDTMAVGAAEACKAAGRSDIKVIGVDGSDEAAALIRAGEMTGTAL